MTDLILQAQGLHKHYGSFTALHQVDLELRQGEVVGFLGPNGAGKTTTMDIICGALARSGGALEYLAKTHRNIHKLVLVTSAICRRTYRSTER